LFVLQIAVALANAGRSPSPSSITAECPETTLRGCAILAIATRGPGAPRLAVLLSSSFIPVWLIQLYASTGASRSNGSDRLGGGNPSVAAGVREHAVRAARSDPRLLCIG
jgi:hypothetical protein